MQVLRIAAFLTAAGCWSAFAQAAAYAPVSPQMLLDGQKDPTKWLMFSGDYTSQRHSPLKQITAQNVARLAPRWFSNREPHISLPPIGRQISEEH